MPTVGTGVAEMSVVMLQQHEARHFAIIDSARYKLIADLELVQSVWVHYGNSWFFILVLRLFEPHEHEIPGTCLNDLVVSLIIAFIMHVSTTVVLRISIISAHSLERQPAGKIPNSSLWAQP